MLVAPHNIFWLKCSSCLAIFFLDFKSRVNFLINWFAERRFEERKELAEFENEYDSELDDFIDDEEEDGLGFDGNGHGSADDVLAELRKITGYDPSR